MRILLVEDDKLLGEGIQLGLQQEGHIIEWLKDGKLAEYTAMHEQFDAIILDLGLPRVSGLDILKNMRQENVATPVMILTARDGIDERVKGLDLGADDYLTKPFDLSEISARLRAITRRSMGRATPMIKHNNITLDPASREVTLKDKPIKISRREFALLHTLLTHAGKVISRNHIIESLYGWEEDIDSNALEVHIHHLRKKFGNHFIRTIRGIGYMIHKT